MRWRFGEFALDRERRELTRGETPVPLQPKQFDLLALLLDRWPAAVAKEEIYRRLWPDVVVEEANLHNLVADLRRLLDDAEHQRIRTVHRFGYAVDGEVEIETDGRRESAFELRIGAKAFPLHEGANVIGRDDDADIPLDAPGISRRHARIVVGPDGAVVEDLGSKNGTFVGTARVTAPTPVREGDPVVFARVAATFCKRRSKRTTITEND